jgi:tRNA A37 threonylcarbamoyltransferase TsaD
MCGTAVTGNRKEIPFRYTFYLKNRISCSFSGISASSLSVAQNLTDKTLNYNVTAVIT